MSSRNYKSHFLTLALMLASVVSVVAQVRTVTTTADSGPGSLREALTTVPTTAVNFSSAINGQNIGLLSPVVITQDLAINGNGRTTTTVNGAAGTFVISAGRKVQFFNIGVVGARAVSGAAINAMNAEVSVFDCAFGNNLATGAAATEGGGAIWVSGGKLIIQRTVLYSNRANGTSGSGGAIFVGNGAELSVTECTFDYNIASRAGGAIEDATGASTTAFVTNTTFVRNAANANPGSGGAYHISGAGNLNINGGEVRDNNAKKQGGGLWNGTGNMNVGGVVFTNNQASGPNATDGGGAIYAQGGKVLITGNTRFIGNGAQGAAGSGGALLVDEGAMLEAYNAFFQGNGATRAGGAIENNAGAGVTLKFGNVTIVGGLNGSFPGNGGGYHATGAGSVEFHGGVIRDNFATGSGGALWNGTGNMLLLATQVLNNSAGNGTLGQGGGGIYNMGGRVSIQNGAVLRGNLAYGFPSGSGGAILNTNGGTIVVDNATISANGAVRAGGGIEDFSNTGSLKLTSVTMDANNAYANPGSGGAVHVTGGASVLVDQSTITNNRALKQGGGLWNGTGVMTISSTTFSDNEARGNQSTDGGGAVYNAGGTVVVTTRTTFNDNVAGGTGGSGGAIFNAAGGTLNVFNTTMTANRATRAGGAIEDASGTGGGVEIFSTDFTGNKTGAIPGNGGALHVTGAGNVLIKDGVLANNFASSEGGAVWNGSGRMVLGDLTFNDNVARGNSAENGGGAVYNEAGTVEITSVDFNRNMADGDSGSGGAINNQGTAIIRGGNFTGNTASRAGGAIEDRGNASLTLRDVRIVDNRTGAAPGNGGGIHVTGSAAVVLHEVEFRNNFAASEGGGFWHGTGQGTVVMSRFDGNVAAGNAADNGGGGIFNEGGALDIDSTTITNNVATGTSGSGGGIFYNVGSSGSISRSVINGNRASRAGGGIEDNSRGATTVAVNSSMIAKNFTGSKPGNGGGIHITSDGIMTVAGCQILGNVAANEGGGLWNGSGSMTVTETTVANNTADGSGGGGIYNQGGLLTVSRSLVAANTISSSTGIGAGILNDNSGTTRVNFTTISGNQSAFNAGGIANAGVLEVTAATIAQNSAANRGGGIGQAPGATTATLRSTIVGLNTAPTQGANLDVAAGAYLSAGYNLIESDDANVFPTAATDKEGTAAAPVTLGLQPLANNGGPTETHAIVCGSDAVNMGDPSLAGVDQRGRPLFGLRDIGAFELQTTCPPMFAPTNPVVQNVTTFSVYPTQTRGNVTIALDEEFSVTTAEEGEVIFRLVDQSGRMLRQIQGGSDRIEVGTSDLTPGSYFVQRTTETGVESRAFQVLD